MIKINLINPNEGRSSSSGLGGGSFDASGGSDGLVILSDDARRDAFKRLFIVLLPPVLLFLYQGQIIPKKEEEVAAKSQVLNKLVEYNSKQAASVAEIKKFKEDEAKIEAKITVLTKIAKDRLREIRVMDLLQQVIPEKAWLRRVSIGQTKLSIEGTALSDFEVSSFMEALTRSAFLMDVNLVTSSEVIIEGSSYKSFEINCKLEEPNNEQTP